MYDPKVPVSKVPKAPPEIQLLINSIFFFLKKIQPAVVALKKKLLSLVFKFRDDMLANAGKWTPWAAPRRTRANTTYAISMDSMV